MAKMLYPCMVSLSLCEVNFRDQEYLYCSRRLRTMPDRFNKLLFIYSNNWVTKTVRYSVFCFINT